ncbi:MAG: ribonuclease HI family protein [Patescibacteria group bacterium]
MKLITFSDGGARGNPGPAAYGVVIKDADSKLLKQHGRYIGHTTNNQAEYRGLVDALEHAKDMGATEVACFLDSELLVKQMKGEYRVKDPELAKLYVRVHNLMIQIGKVSFTHVRRELNKEADAMVNKALDEHH